MQTKTPQNLFKSEALSSAIPLELFKQNAIALDGDETLEYLLIGNVSRTNTGAISSGIFKQYSHLADGGLWFGGWSLDLGYDDPWGVLKPITPTTASDGKTKKYETPPKYPWEKIPVFLPKPDPALEEKIRARFGNENPQLPWDKWLLATDCPIAIVEGAKKAIAVLATGLPCIGLYSLWSFANKIESGKELKPELKALLQRSNAYFIVDNDRKEKQRRNAETAISQFAGLVKTDCKQCELKIVDFAELHEEKGIDDLFASILKRGASTRLTLADLIKRALNPIAWMQHRKENRKHKKHDIFISAKYLDYKTLKPCFNSENKIIAIKSPKGTGKTELMKSLVADNKLDYKKTIIITHREALSRANAQRCGLPYWRDAIAVNRRDGFGLCIDSLRTQSELSFNASHYRGCDVVIDEVDQVIRHLLTSSTCREHRIDIFNELRDLVRECDRLFLLDADLSANTLEFFEDLHPKGTMTICNLLSEVAYPLEICDRSNPSELVATALTAAQNGDRLLILADSQKAKSKYSTSSLSRLFSQNTTAKVLRIDSETLADPDSNAFKCLANLDEIIKNHDVVICSPSVGTGISIDLKGHFTTVYGIFCGVLSPSSIRQFLLRLRDTVPARKIWIPRLGLSQFGNGSDKAEALALLQSRKWNATLKYYGVTNVWDVEGDRLCSAFQDAFYRIAALTNYEKYNYRALVREGLRLEGCLIEEFSPNHTYDKKEFLGLVSGNRNSNYLEQIERELDAPDLSEHEFKCLEKHDSLTLDNQAATRKYTRKEKYKIDITEDLIRLDDGGLYGRLKMLYYLNFQDIAEHKDKNYLTAQADKKVFLPDSEKRTSSLKIKLFKLLGLDAFIVDSIGQAEIYSSRDSKIIEAAERCISYAQNIRDIFGVKISVDCTPLKIVSHLIKKVLGLGLEFQHRSGSRGEQQRFYASAVIPDLFHNIMAKWLECDVEAIAKQSEAAKPHP